MTKLQRYLWELKTLTEGMVKGSDEWIEQTEWLKKKNKKAQA